ncbi:hypothetical protein DENSPDRAFT_252494 [Dentipellis sp. KUC8613]|nr:hypothetical protein DENSPDRAFT_252494 [Dentipellis sp. KUC8613]
MILKAVARYPITYTSRYAIEHTDSSWFAPYPVSWLAYLGYRHLPVPHRILTSQLFSYQQARGTGFCYCNVCSIFHRAGQEILKTDKRSHPTVLGILSPSCFSDATPTRRTLRGCLVQLPASHVAQKCHCGAYLWEPAAPRSSLCGSLQGDAASTPRPSEPTAPWHLLIYIQILTNLCASDCPGCCGQGVRQPIAPLACGQKCRYHMDLTRRTVGLRHGIRACNLQFFFLPKISSPFRRAAHRSASVFPRHAWPARGKRV